MSNNASHPLVLIDAPHITQMPELPRGCEVTSLAMLLAFAGIQVDKMTLAKEIKRDLTAYKKNGNQIYFGNPYDGFVGDMYSFDNPGLGVYHGPIMELASTYLPGKVEDLTGREFSAIIDALHNGTPVWVVVTSTYNIVPDSLWQTWNTPTGKIAITYKEHSVLITGYDEEFIYFNDPLQNKNDKALKKSFIAGWEQLGKQAITIKKEKTKNG